ncbi:hypothetical protein [Actinoplanes sp. NPDC026619]|uniref:hypothetical protein n=1 Tax=Actinoplanes sp. NPDC026619 TaxID=3155798 RepID=UPI0033E74780
MSSEWLWEADEVSESLVLDSGGTVVRKALYRRGKLFQARYFSDDPPSLLARHAREYPGLEAAFISEEDAPAGFRWRFMARYAADGSSLGFITRLIDPTGSELMSLEHGAADELVVISKFWDELPDQDGMLFEYGSDGRNYMVVDLEDGDTLKFSDVLGALAEPDFYADGFALPPQLAGASIPSARDHFQS